MNRNMYEEKKHFNAIDALIVLAAIVMVVLIIFRSQIIAFFNDTGNKSECEISFVCESLPNDITAQVQNGATVTWIDTDISLGRLEITSPAEAADVFYTENNELHVKKSTTDSKFTGIITTVAISNNGCYVNGSDFIATGMTVLLSTDLVQFSALITDIKFTDN